MYALILCGGSGTRLWPLSRRNYAKQFLKLYSDQSLLQETYLRARKLTGKDKIFFVTNKNGYVNVLEQIQAIEPEFEPSNIIIEPTSLNTAPALACAVKYLLDRKGVQRQEQIVSFHADHYIRDTEEYVALLQVALEQLGDHIGTIGIEPTKPETGYGYIRKGKQQGEYFMVAEFCEKPPLERAKEYLASGQYVWNSGMYLFSVQTFLGEIEKYAPEISSLMQKDWEGFLDGFSSLPAVSIDNAVSEKSDRVIVFPGNFGWSDIGSFDSLADLGQSGFLTRHISIDDKNVLVHSEGDKLIATIGLEDVVVVEAGDSILVYKRGRAEEVKKVVEKLKEGGAKEIDRSA
ncbi:MAG: mannose-1-phosphate guanylyltransferase [Candidatus Moraniibacteriota bacterium]|nr:MAG: mannose-1-phosphate guanylyltransferase [Candidatus Moranbacteria bacterium]